MHSKILTGLLLVSVSGVVGAQPPAPRSAGAGVPAAEMLLANTGRLQLTDQQVVRLAAIARRGDARRQSMRASMDSARGRFQGRPMATDTAARRQFAEQMRTTLQRAREQGHADRRDAIAVLTPDQQARAWEMVAARGRAMRGAQGMGRGMRRGMGPGARQGPATERARRPFRDREMSPSRRP